MTKEEEDTLYDSCHEEIDGLLVLSNVRIRLAIRAAYAKGMEDAAKACHNSIQVQGPYFATLIKSKLAAAIREGK